MNARDKAILNDLTRFRCMTRDDIAAIHFSKVKNPITQSNTVLKRLRRDGHITCSTERRMYLYFPVPGIKKGSAKIPHHLATVDFYRQLIAIESPHTFTVEPRIGGKGTIEPDIFMIWQRTPFFVEIQISSIYSKKVMDAKIKRYEEYYHSDAWKKEPWQPAEKKHFPRLWIVSAAGYSLGELPFKVVQTRAAAELLQRA